jgi:hypothetical protein
VLFAVAPASGFNLSYLQIYTSFSIKLFFCYVFTSFLSLFRLPPLDTFAEKKSFSDCLLLHLYAFDFFFCCLDSKANTSSRQKIYQKMNKTVTNGKCFGSDVQGRFLIASGLCKKNFRTKTADFHCLIVCRELSFCLNFGA